MIERGKMSKRKRTLLYILSFVAAVCVFAALFAFAGEASAYTDTINITSASGDAFRSEGTVYGADESFVFSARLNFKGGHAAALTFGETEKGLWAFNMDRESNGVKILYFEKQEDGYAASELKREVFLGNDKMTNAEREKVNPLVKTAGSVHLKIVLKIKGKAAFIECYADGIRRFAYTDGSAPASDLDLNSAFGADYSYKGGGIGFNVCNADVDFTDVYTGAEDDNAYNELYRNKVSYSPFSHWNNDPNGLVYYNGYYHLYYQHHPFGKTWGDMYWGHARSTDLLHWENLPVCLFPEREGVQGSFAQGDGYMWSGTARVYHKGESTVIDSERWFKNSPSLANGEAAGIIIFYTRDGYWQDQMIASSDDGGLTWTKRRLIDTHTALGLHRGEKDGKPDCRDPKVFDFTNGSQKIYGMLVTGMATDDVWFLKSTDLVNWTAAGGFKARVPLVNSDKTNGPECPDIAKLTADDGSEKWVITLSGRGYLVGDLSFDGNSFKYTVNGTDVSSLPTAEPLVQQMDFGPDSYATQTFFTEDGEYAGKTLSLSWFSGVPGAEASVNSGLLTELRDPWNCGMTIPVIWGLKKTADGYILTQTPVTKDKNTLKTVLASASNLEVEAGKNVLSGITASVFDIDAEISNPDGGAVYFRVRVGSGEYTEIGWNEEDGYYFDRTHTSDGNVTLPAYAGKYCAVDNGKKIGGGEKLSFYILVDDGGVQAFCGDGAAPFYAVTFAAPASVGMSFYSENAVTFDKLNINRFSTGWRETKPANYLLTGSDSLELDLTLCKYRDVAVSGSGGVSYSVSGGEAITYAVTESGIRVFAEQAGEAVIKAACGDKVQFISVKVYGGEADSDCGFNNVTAGDWYRDESGYIAKIKSGDGFIYSEREGADFFYSAKFDMKSGIAAALVFRAKADLSQYIIVNYDDKSEGGKGLVKLWSSAGDDYRAVRKLGGLNDIVLAVSAQGNKIKVTLNGEVIRLSKYVDGEEVNKDVYAPQDEVTLDGNAPKSGLFGLNICEAEVLFKCVSVTDDFNKGYAGGDIVWSHTDDTSFTIVNLDWNNRQVDGSFYTFEGRKVTLSQNYMASLPEGDKTYRLEVTGKNSRYILELNIGALPQAVWKDFSVQAGVSAVFYIGRGTGAVKVNGQEIDPSLYKIEGERLTVYADAFVAGENTVSFGNLSAKVTVNGTEVLAPHFNAGHWTEILTALFVIVGAVILAEGALIAVILLKKKGKEDGGND